MHSEIDFIALGIEPGATDFRGVPWQTVPAPLPPRLQEQTPESSGDLA